MGKRKREGESETFAIKCGLGRLLPSLELREAIEKAVLRAHPVLVQGLLVATHTALHLLQQGKSVPITDQKWWYGCMSACGDACMRSALDTDIAASLDELRQRHGMKVSTSAYLRPILNAAAVTMKANGQVAIAQTFHNNLKRAFSRIVSIYEAAYGDLDGKVRYRTLQSAMNLCLGARRATWHITVPNGVREVLNERIRDWRSRYADVLPCVFPQSIKEAAVGRFLEWNFELHLHVDECIQLGDEISFRKGDLKKTSILPLGSHKVKFIQIDAGVMSDGIWPMAGYKVGEVKTPLADLFPGVAALCPRGSAFAGSLKTDGVSASVVFTRPKVDGGTDDKCVWKPFKGLVHRGFLAVTPRTFLCTEIISKVSLHFA